ISKIPKTITNNNNPPSNNLSFQVSAISNSNKTAIQMAKVSNSVAMVLMLKNPCLTIAYDVKIINKRTKYGPKLTNSDLPNNGNIRLVNIPKITDSAIPNTTKKTCALCDCVNNK